LAGTPNLAVAIQSDGQILIGGPTSTGLLSQSPGLAMVRLKMNGSLDMSFGIRGMAATSIFGPSGLSVAVQNDGKIVVTGSATGTSGNFALARFNTDGSLDANFGSSGFVTANFSGLPSVASAVSVQAGGRILVGGSAQVSGITNFALAGFNANGSLDTSVGT